MEMTVWLWLRSEYSSLSECELLTGTFWHISPPGRSRTPVPARGSWPRWGVQGTDLQRRGQSLSSWNPPHTRTIAGVITKTTISQRYLQAARCLSSARSWCYSRRCRYSWPLRGTGTMNRPCDLLCFVTVRSTPASVPHLDLHGHLPAVLQPR